MKNLIREIGLSILGFVIICFGIAIFLLILNGVGHITNGIFMWENKNFMDYVCGGAIMILILMTIIVFFVFGYLLMSKFVPVYKGKKKTLEYPYDLESCDKLDTSGMSKIDCEDCERYNKGIRPSKL